MLHKNRGRQLALALILALTLPACSPPWTVNTGNDTLKTTQTATMLVGKAFLNEPISGATLKIFDLSGNILQEASNATDANGYFNLSLPASTPKDFRVEVSGGLCGTAASTSVLKADVRNFDSTIDRLYINAATTLVAAKLDQNPQVALKDVQASVARFLKLPSEISLGADLDNSSLKLFSHATFMNVAAEQGGFNPFITTLAGQITGDATTTYDFSRQLLNGIAGDIAKTVALEIGKGALSKIGGTLMGCALDSIFGPSEMSPDELRQQFADLRDATVKGFRDLDTRMVTLQNDIGDVKRSISALEVSMNKQFGLAAYNTKIDALLTSIATIDTLYDSYLYELDRFDTSAAGKARITALVDQIQSSVPTALTTIHYAMVGTGGGDGAIVQWHRVVGNNNRNGENGNRYPYLVNAAFVGQLNDQFEYFEGLQLRGIDLLVEARNFKKDATGAKIDYDRFIANVETQRAQVYTPRLTSDVVISPFKGLMWDRTPLDNGGSPLFTITADFATDSIPTKLSGLRTGDYTDWRMPTIDELLMLGSGDPTRNIFMLIQAGFRLQQIPLNNCNGTLSSSKNPDYYWYINTSGAMGLLYTYPKTFFVLPTRTYKVDSLATP